MDDNKIDDDHFSKRFTEKVHCEKRASMGQWRSVVKEAIDRTVIIAKFLCLLHVTNNYICSPTLVYGPSMLPTLNLTGDVLLAEHVSHRVGRVGPGDVVLVRSPRNPRKMLTKRIVGVEGDKVNFYPDPANSNQYQSAVVPKGHVWIQGDNVYASRDSRHFGPVPYGLIEGKAFLRVWPPDCFGRLDQ
uniref:Peptidase S26 domain-containing protein n=2 Tax=Cucumis sativus TaxID=3659 RepID=A0A0A0KVI4_CUCSA